eukprot:2677953-Rhodomonas_salina.1
MRLWNHVDGRAGRCLAGRRTPGYALQPRVLQELLAGVGAPDNLYELSQVQQHRCNSLPTPASSTGESLGMANSFARRDQLSAGRQRLLLEGRVL